MADRDPLGIDLGLVADTAAMAAAVDPHRSTSHNENGARRRRSLIYLRSSVGGQATGGFAPLGLHRPLGALFPNDRPRLAHQGASDDVIEASHRDDLHAAL